MISFIKDSWIEIRGLFVYSYKYMYIHTLECSRLYSSICPNPDIILWAVRFHVFDRRIHVYLSFLSPSASLCSKSSESGDTFIYMQIFVRWSNHIWDTNYEFIWHMRMRFNWKRVIREVHMPLRIRSFIHFSLQCKRAAYIVMIAAITSRYCPNNLYARFIWHFFCYLWL